MLKETAFDLMKNKTILKDLFIYEVIFDDGRKSTFIASNKQEIYTMLKEKIPPFYTFLDMIQGKPKHVLYYSAEDVKSIDKRSRIDVIGEITIKPKKKNPSKLKIWLIGWYDLILAKTKAPTKER